MPAKVLTFTSRACAAPGLRSYRYRGRYGYIMIGATDHADALIEASRSTEAPVRLADLEVWKYDNVDAGPEGRYVPIKETR